MTGVTTTRWPLLFPALLVARATSTQRPVPADADLVTPCIAAKT